MVNWRKLTTLHLQTAHTLLNKKLKKRSVVIFVFVVVIFVLSTLSSYFTYSRYSIHIAYIIHHTPYTIHHTSYIPTQPTNQYTSN
jgi:CHASE3 domain sensor protein